MGSCSQIDEVLCQEDVCNGGQQEHVGSGPDPQVFVGRISRTGADGVDHDHPSAARFQGTNPARHVGNGHHRSVGDQRVGADDDEQVGPVDVRHRDGQFRAIHQSQRDLLRHLVHSARREPVAGAQRPYQCRQVERAGHVVCVRVAQIGRDGVRAGLADDLTQSRTDPVEGLVPRGRPQGVTIADHRSAQSGGVVVEVADRHPFGHTKPRLNTSSASPRTPIT